MARMPFGMHAAARSENDMTTTKLAVGLYKIVVGDKTYIVENVKEDVGVNQWNISEQVVTVAGALYRIPPFDAANTLKQAKALIAGFDHGLPLIDVL